MGDDSPRPLEDLTKGADKENCSGKHLENENLEKCIEEEATLIAKIFPLLQHETIKGMLTKLGNLPKRSRAVLRQLSMQTEQNKSADKLNLKNGQQSIKAMFNNMQVGFRSSSNLLIKKCDPDVISIIDDDQFSPSQAQYKKLDFNRKFSLLTRILPDAEPNYLKTQLVRIANNTNQFNLFVNNALKFRSYPKKTSTSQVTWNKILQSQLNNGNFGRRATAHCGHNSHDVFPWPVPVPNSRQKRPAPPPKKKKQKNTDDEVNLDELFSRSKENFNSPYPHTSQAYNLGNFGQNLRGAVQPNCSKSFPNRTDEISRVPSTLVLPKEDPALYTTKFNVENFVKTIPNPETYFRENRHNKPWSGQCEQYATCALFNIYKKIGLDKIKECIFIAPNFLAACDMLDKVTQLSGKFRPDLPMPSPVDDIPLLKEIAYKAHHAEILHFITAQKEVFRLKIAEAEEAGLSHNCECCYNKEVLPEDVFKCEKNCCFCRNCIRASVEASSSSNGQGTLACLNNCQAQFSLNTLQRALPEELFAKIMGKKLHENLEYCPFCDFGAVPVMEGTVFNCLNVDCLKASCRMCRAANHMPDPCKEIEQDENVMARTYIENKMTEAILRECYECNMKFVKSGGCNTIACPCGAQMCYICRKPVTDLYLHRGCQKHSVAKIDEEMVMKAAMDARKEVLSILKIDPTVGMKRYFDELRKINLELKKEDEAANFFDNGNVDIFIGHSKRKRGETSSSFRDTHPGASASNSMGRAKRIARS